MAINQSFNARTKSIFVFSLLLLPSLSHSSELTYEGVTYNVGVTDFSVDTESVTMSYWLNPAGDPNDFNSYSDVEIAGWEEVTEEFEEAAATQSNYDAWYTLVSAQPWFYDTSDLATVEEREAFFVTHNSYDSEISIAAFAELTEMPDLNDVGGRAVLWVVDTEGTDLGGYPTGAVFYQSYDDNRGMLQGNADATHLFDKTLYEIVPTLSAVSSTGTLKNVPAYAGAVVIDTTSELLQLFVDANLTGDQDVSNAVSQTLPLLTGSSVEGVRSASTSINRIIQSRIVDNNRGMSSGDAEIGTDKYMWIKPFSSWADQDDVLSISGFGSQTEGLAIGADGAINDTTRLGLAVSHANSRIVSNSSIAPQNADINLYQVIGYGSKTLTNDTELYFQVDYGINNNKSSRSILFTDSVASSSYGSKVAHAAVGLGKTYAITDKNSFTAYLHGDYTVIKDDAYVETGAGDLNLSVDSRTSKEFIVSIDGKYQHAFDKNLSLATKVGVGYDTINEQASLTAAYAGAPNASFVTDGLRPDPVIGKVGIGLLYQADSGVELTLDYDSEYRDGFLNQTASFKARWMF